MSAGLAHVALHWAEPASHSADPSDWIYIHELAGQRILSVRREGPRYLVRVCGVADYWVSEDAKSVEIVPLPTVERARVQEAFDHQVRPGLHQLLGAPALHAAAVSTPVGIVAFVGASGAGKSTLVAHLSLRWQLACDDYLPLRVEGDAAWATGTSGWVRLRDSTLEALGESGRVRNGKTAVDRAHDTEPRRLARIFVLGPASAQVDVSPVSRRDAALLVASHLHRLDPQSPDLLRSELGFVESIAARVPLRRLAFPRAFDRLNEVQAAIERDLEGL